MSPSKNIFVTGASAGFGYDATKALALKGHRVCATMRDVAGKNAEKAKTLETWAKEGGHTVHILDLDVTDEQSINRAVAAALERGPIDVLINNAGIGNMGIDEAFTVEQAQRIFNVNLFGVMRVNRAVVPHLRQAGQGLIVYLSSGLGRIILPFMAIYTASKFAIEAYAEGTSYELAPHGIQSVIVQPGAFSTSFGGNSIQPQNTSLAADYGQTTKMFEGFVNAFQERFQAGEIGDPAEVVKTLVEEVERETGDRPLRRPVGRDVLDPVSAINETCEHIQDQLLTAAGMK